MMQQKCSPVYLLTDVIGAFVTTAFFAPIIGNPLSLFMEVYCPLCPTTLTLANLFGNIYIYISNVAVMEGKDLLCSEEDLKSGLV